MNANLPIFGIEKKDLKDFTTTEKDMNKGQNRFPPTQMRLKGEDLLKETVEVAKNDVIDTTFTVDNYNEQVELRNMQYQESKKFENTADEDEEEEDEQDQFE
jgi:hypothetical protein